MGLTANLVPQQDNTAGGSNGTGAPVTHLTDQTFNDQIKQGYTFVDFWADWCAPCKMVAPTIDKLAEKWQGKIKFAKMDTDANPVVPGTFGIMSIPTFILFKDGQPVDSIMGAMPEQAFEQFLRKNYQE